MFRIAADAKRISGRCAPQNAYFLAWCPFRALRHLLKGTETAQEKTYRITEGV